MQINFLQKNIFNKPFHHHFALLFLKVDLVVRHHSWRNIHCCEFLEKQFARIGYFYIREVGPVITSLT